jgi:hypothetical protein
MWYWNFPGRRDRLENEDAPLAPTEMESRVFGLLRGLAIVKGKPDSENGPLA